MWATAFRIDTLTTAVVWSFDQDSGKMVADFSRHNKHHNNKLRSSYVAAEGLHSLVLHFYGAGIFYILFINLIYKLLRAGANKKELN